MSGNDGIYGIEDEPYEGLYRGVMQPKQLSETPGHLPDRFDLAEILKTARAAKGLTLEQVSEITRVRPAYLEALEQAAYDILPSRPFAIGHVRAYAKALDLDEESLVEMFKRDLAEPQARLHAPSGASLEDVKPRYRLFVTVGVCLVVAIVAWNILQYKPVILAARSKGDNFASQKWTQGMPLIRDGVMLLTKPAPAPRDQDIPQPYITPGLEDGFASIAATTNASSQAPVPVQDVLPSHAFNPAGAVYGAAPETSAVTMQATRSVALTVHDAAGNIFFAHQFSPGEAYRLPQADSQGLIVDISDAKGFDIYYNGEYAGPWDTARAPVSQVNARAAQMASALDAKQASQHQVASVFTAEPAPEAPVAIKKSDQPIPYMPATAATPKPETVVKKPVDKALAPPAGASASSTEPVAAAVSSSAPQ